MQLCACVDTLSLVSSGVCYGNNFNSPLHDSLVIDSVSQIWSLYLRKHDKTIDRASFNWRVKKRTGGTGMCARLAAGMHKQGGTVATWMGVTFHANKTLELFILSIDGRRHCTCFFVYTNSWRTTHLNNPSTGSSSILILNFDLVNSCLWKRIVGIPKHSPFSIYSSACA